MLCRCMNRFAKPLLVSSIAAACVGPNTFIPRRRSSSTSPSESGSSGPTTVKSGPSAATTRSRSFRSFRFTATQRAIPAIPPLPGAHTTSVTRSTSSAPKPERVHARPSRSPEPSSFRAPTSQVLRKATAPRAASEAVSDSCEGVAAQPRLLSQIRPSVVPAVIHPICRTSSGSPLRRTPRDRHSWQQSSSCCLLETRPRESQIDAFRDFWRLVNLPRAIVNDYSHVGFSFLCIRPYDYDFFCPEQKITLRIFVAIFLIDESNFLRGKVCYKILLIRYDRNIEKMLM